MSEQKALLDEVFPGDLSSLVQSFCVPTVFKGHTGDVVSLVISLNNKYLFSGSRDKTICQWCLETGELLQTFQGHTGIVWSLAVSFDNKYLYSGSEDETIRQWAIGNEPMSSSPKGPSGHACGCVQILKGHTGAVTCLVVSPNNKHLYSGSRDYTIRQWYIGNEHAGSSFLTGKPLQILQGHDDFVWCLVASSDGNYLYSGSEDNTIRQWYIGGDDPNNGACVRVMKGHFGAVWSLTVSPDNQHLYSASDDHTIRQWYVGDETTNPVNSPRIWKGHTGYVNCVSVSSNNKYLYSGAGDGTIRQWSIGDVQQNIVSEIVCTTENVPWGLVHKHNSVFFSERDIIRRFPLMPYQDGLTKKKTLVAQTGN